MTDEMRVLESEIGKVVPVVDIAEMIGYSRSSINNVIEGYKEKINPCKTYQSLPTTGGPQQFLCLNRQGVDYLFLIIHPSKTKMSVDQLLEFRKSILYKLDGEPVAVIPANGNGNLKHDLQNAKEYAEICQCDAKVLQAAVFKKHGEPELADALRLPTSHGEPGWYNPTRLISLCNDPDLTPERLNWYLTNKGFQYREGYLWRLTPAGMVHGQEYTYESPSGHREVRIRWRESILYASGLKRQMSESQLALPARV